MNIVSWILRLLAAIILLQTLFYKFTGAEESKYIFRTLGMELWGRIGTGIAELVASVLLLPATKVYGALFALALMAGAILSHLTQLGISVQGDGGLLFFSGVTVFVASAALVWIHRRERPLVGDRF